MLPDYLVSPALLVFSCDKSNNGFNHANKDKSKINNGVDLSRIIPNKISAFNYLFPGHCNERVSFNKYL